MNSLYFNGEENFWQIFYMRVGPQVWYRGEEVFFIVYVIGVLYIGIAITVFQFILV